jgi:hypothetical protein
MREASVVRAHAFLLRICLSRVGPKGLSDASDRSKARMHPTMWFCKNMCVLCICSCRHDACLFGRASLH